MEGPGGGEAPNLAAQQEAVKLAAEQEVDTAMEEIFNVPSAREAAADASRAADRVIEAQGRELTGEARRRALLDDVPTSLRREKLLDGLPISIRRCVAEDMVRQDGDGVHWAPGSRPAASLRRSPSPCVPYGPLLGRRIFFFKKKTC